MYSCYQLRRSWSVAERCRTPDAGLSASLQRGQELRCPRRRLGLFEGAIDALAGIREINRVALDADESLAGEYRGDPGSPAAEKRVQNAGAGKRVAEVLHLRQRTGAGHGVIAAIVVPGPQVVHVPVARQVVAEQRAAAPEDDRVPAEAGSPAASLRVQFARRDDAIALGEILVPAVGCEGVCQTKHGPSFVTRTSCGTSRAIIASYFSGASS